MNEWYTIRNVERVDSPALILYPDRIRENIRLLKTYVPETHRLRPHVKTHKSGDVSSLLIDAGISKFKCATIAEAEMLADAGAADVLLAYQPVGPKAKRLLALTEKFPGTVFSCLIDNAGTASALSELFNVAKKNLRVFIDLNVGMNRTGIVPGGAEGLYDDCRTFSGIVIAGLHAYDGHLRDPDLAVRTAKCEEAYRPVAQLAARLQAKQNEPVTIVAGGTPTFPIHAHREEAECSPGTFIYWDYGYKQTLPEQPWLFAALVITRVISKPAADLLCLDLGHKSIASENPLQQRVHFLNAPGLEPVGHSEEHMVVKGPEASSLIVGDVLYGLPYHICPTCALYDTASVAQNHEVSARWNILSRKRSLTI